MCGRFANHIQQMREWADLFADWPEGAYIGFNVAPTMTIPVFTPEGGHAMRWGLIPAWAKEIGKFSTYNARLESVTEKPAYRHAWRAGQRCLVPILGYYEWRKEGKIKQPYFIRAESGAPLAMAGLWEPGRDEFPASCTVLTTEALPELADIHPRMPVFISRAHAEPWYEASPQGLLDQMQTWEPKPLMAYRVSTAVNSGKVDGPELIEPVEE